MRMLHFCLEIVFLLFCPAVLFSVLKLFFFGRVSNVLPVSSMTLRRLDMNIEHSTMALCAEGEGWEILLLETLCAARYCPSLNCHQPSRGDPVGVAALVLLVQLAEV